MAKFKKTIMIDLDGVLNNYTKYDENSIPEIKNGAKEFLQSLVQDYNLVLYTTRNSQMASKWLIDNNINMFFSDVTSVKLPAYIYLDDRAIQFKGDYNSALNDIKNFKVYWKN